MADIRGGVTLVRESAVGSVDGVNTTFTTTGRYISGTLRVELNGVKLVRNEDFLEVNDQTFSMVEAPEIDLGYVDKVTVEYERK